MCFMAWICLGLAQLKCAMVSSTDRGQERRTMWPQGMKMISLGRSQHTTHSSSSSCSSLPCCAPGMPTAGTFTCNAPRSLSASEGLRQPWMSQPCGQDCSNGCHSRKADGAHTESLTSLQVPTPSLLRRGRMTSVSLSRPSAVMEPICLGNFGSAPLAAPAWRPSTPEPSLQPWHHVGQGELCAARCWGAAVGQLAGRAWV